MTQQISINQLVDAFLSFYSTNRHRPELASLTDKILSLAFSARGYNNYTSQQASGEHFFIRNILAPLNPRLCIDIGANIGDYSKSILDSTSSRVIAFEPLPRVFESLEIALLQFSDRITLENIGIGEKQEFLTINYNNKATAHASFSKEVQEISYLNSNEALELPVTSLDLYLEGKGVEEINLIKIDTEGFESEVIMGAKESIKKYKPQFIQIEFNWHQLFRNKTLNWFSENLPGYDCYQLVTDGWIKRNPKDPLCNIFLYSNFVFVRIQS